MSRRIKVLQTTMSLDIGGAETHIVALSKYLNSKRYEVQVASNGGVYEKDLEEAGIVHHKVPLHTKHPLAVWRSYRQLKRIIIEEHIDIVHAHARIPGFIAGYISKKLNRPFVTTTHGKFKVNYYLRHLTNWGDKCIAVSEDLKNYLMKEYGYAEEDIYLSVNGIDVDKFKPKDKNCGQKNQIVHVSRLDATTSATALALIAIAPRIAQVAPAMTITIVGGGTELQKVEASARTMNDQLGHEMIHLTGPVQDVPEKLEAAAIFVGISRAVLEAMNYSVPVVLSGDYGHYGYLTEEGLAFNQSTNFTCRGFEPMTEDKLFESIEKALSLRAQDHTWLRTFIEKHYSVERMAAPYLELYANMEKAPKSYVVAGYYGYSNSGDDALLDSICRDLVEDNLANTVTVLTKEPDSHQKHPQIQTVYRFDLLKVMKAIRQTDTLIMGGGSLLQDKSSSRSLWYYLGLIQMANAFNKRCCIYANGVGPLDGKLNRRLTSRIVNRIDLISLRDAMSGDLLSEIGVVNPHIEVTADPVFNLEFDFGQPVEETLLPEDFDCHQPYGVAIFRDWEKAALYQKQVAQVVDHVRATYQVQILFIPMRYPDDMAIEKAIIGHMEEDASLMTNKCHVDQLISLIEHSTLVLSMRLHGMIYSAIAHVPVVGFSYDPKVNYYSQMLGVPVVEDITKMDVAATIRQIDAMMTNYQATRETLALRVDDLTEKADRNAKLLRTLL